MRKMKKKESLLPFAVFDSVNADLPLYRKLYEDLRAAILNGRLQTGTRLPPTRELARELEVSRNTVLNAYNQLLSEGYIEGVAGSGTVVARMLPEDALRAEKISLKSLPNPRRRKLSKRGQNLDSNLADLGERAFGKTIPFRIATPDAASFPFDIWARLINRYTRNPSADLLGYVYPAGYPRLREAIAAYLKSARGVRCEAEQIIIVPGSQIALDIIAQMLLDAGETALMEDPGYFGARGVFARAGINVEPVSIDSEGASIAEIRKHNEARLVYVTPSSQFPLGVSMTLKRRLELLEWARAANAWIIEDDCYGELRYSGRPIPSLQGLDDENRVIYTGTFSKVMFPSLRLGYLVAPPDLVEPFTKARVLTDLHSSTITQAALADFIEDGHFARHLRRMRKLYSARQACLLDEAKKELSGLLEIEERDAGMHLIGWLPEEIDERAAEEKAWRKKIIARPLSGFGLNPLKQGALVLGYTAFDERQIRAAIRRLKIALEETRNESRRFQTTLNEPTATAVLCFEAS